MKARFPNSSSMQEVRFVRIVAYNEWGGAYYTTIAELDFLAAK